MFDYAEQIAVWMLGLSDSGKELFVWVEGAAVLLLCGGVWLLWHAGRLRALPYRSQRADYLTYRLVRSVPLSAVVMAVLCSAVLFWLGMVVVEYAAWNSPEAGAVYRRMEAMDNTFDDVWRRDMRGRVAGVIATICGIGAGCWGLVCLFRARSHVRTLGEG